MPHLDGRLRDPTKLFPALDHAIVVVVRGQWGSGAPPQARAFHFSIVPAGEMVATQQLDHPPWCTSITTRAGCQATVWLSIPQHPLDEVGCSPRQVAAHQGGTERS